MNPTVARSGSDEKVRGATPPYSRLGGWIFPAIALGLFMLLGAASYRATSPHFGWDLAVSQKVQGISWFGLESLLRIVCLADNDLLQAILLVCGVGLVFAARGARREAVILVGVVVVAQALCALSGKLVGRPRPSTELIQLRIDPAEIAGYPSFPSGHTVHYTAFFGFLGFLALTRLKPRALSWPLASVFVALVLLIGPARIFLGAHWLSDVVGGYLLGGAALASGVHLYRGWSSTSSDPELQVRK